MPELPEVETIVNDLKKPLKGLKILDVWCDHKKMIKSPASFDKFKKEIVGEKFLSVSRKGKNILINLSGNKTLLVHQKMTGHLMYGKFEIQKNKSETKWISLLPGPHRDDPQNRFIHLVFTLSNGRHLALCDMRKFAKVLIWPTNKLDELKDISSLGPDPLEKSFNFKKFAEILRGSPSTTPRVKHGKIKQVLMDQNLIAGIGNIYSDEILWFAGVHPFKDVSGLKEKELKLIFKYTLAILKKSIKARGTSSSDFRDLSGNKGNFQKMLSVYQTEGEKCKKRDGGIIKRIKMGGRSAHFCPIHQKL